LSGVKAYYPFYKNIIRGELFFFFFKWKIEIR
jgi:hypothetical protein